MTAERRIKARWQFGSRMLDDAARAPIAFGVDAFVLFEGEDVDLAAGVNIHIPTEIAWHMVVILPAIVFVARGIHGMAEF